MDRIEKKEAVENLKKVFDSCGVLVVMHNLGLKVSDARFLRREVRKVGGSYSVVKNTLAKIGLAETQYDGMQKDFSGPVSIAYAEEPVALMKVLVDFAKKNQKLQLSCAALGQDRLDSDGIKRLASLPSLDELRGKLVGIISTPASQLLRVFKEPGGKVARVLNSYSNKEN